MSITATSGFRKLSLLTLVAVYFLILVGAVVRSTGSGMGCPDWPKCFGSFIPPSSVEELPSDYKEVYSAIRAKKNEKFIRTLRAVGMTETASKLESDKSVLVEEEFNPTKTKIEYVNRLVGVVIGFLITLVLYQSWRMRKTDLKIFLAALGAWISVVFTGWFGSIVVSTNLTPWTISVHLGFALIIVALLVYVYQRTRDQSMVTFQFKITDQTLILACLGLTLSQIIFGIQVRQALDKMAFEISDRSQWISGLGMEFVIHRSFSWIVLLGNCYLSNRIRNYSSMKTLSNALALLTLASIATGVGMAYGSVPAYLQPLHLLISSITFGILWMITLQSRKQKINTVND